MSDVKPDKRNHLVSAMFQKDLAPFTSYVLIARTEDETLFVSKYGSNELVLGLLKAAELYVGNEVIQQFEESKERAKDEQR